MSIFGHFAFRRNTKTLLFNEKKLHFLAERVAHQLSSWSNILTRKLPKDNPPSVILRCVILGLCNISKAITSPPVSNSGA